jgi:hypothetical protein
MTQLIHVQLYKDKVTNFVIMIYIYMYIEWMNWMSLLTIIVEHHLNSYTVVYSQDRKKSA